MASLQLQLQTDGKLQPLISGSPQVQAAAKLQADASRWNPQLQARASEDAAPVQRQELESSIHQTARSGLGGSGGRLPFLDQIQKAFGRHDVSQVQAHSDSKAAAASRAIGAEAFAMGNRVAFAGAPSLHTTAHEAAHVVQQRAGVQLKGGVGQVGDRYERQADAAADAVVRGESAEAILGVQHAGGRASASSVTDAPVQRTLFVKKHNEQKETPISRSALKEKTPAIGQLWYSYLSLLEAAEQDYVFNLNENGEVSLQTMEAQIKAYLQSNANRFDKDHNPNLWSFAMAKKGGWRLRSEAGMWAADTDSPVSIKIDLTHFGHLTAKVRKAFEDKHDADGHVKKEDAMLLPTGLDYEEWHGASGLLRRMGVLGGTLLSASGVGADAGALHPVRQKIFQEWRVVELDQDEPRHVGTHDQDNPGVLPHFHVVKLGGGVWTKQDKARVLEFVQETGVAVEIPRKIWEQQKKNRPAGYSNAPDEAWDLFLKAELVDEEDIKARNDILTVKKKSEVQARKLFEAHYDWFKWKA